MDLRRLTQGQLETSLEFGRSPVFERDVTVENPVRGGTDGRFGPRTEDTRTDVVRRVSRKPKTGPLKRK